MWGQQWGMHFNTGKCNILTMPNSGKHHPIFYNINGQILQQVPSTLELLYMTLLTSHVTSQKQSPKQITYEERLKRLHLPTLKYRRIRGDMIEVYKIFIGKYDTTVTNWLTGRHVERYYDLRGHKFSIYQSQISYELSFMTLENIILQTE